MEYPVLDIANKILAVANDYLDAGEFVCNMKLQKLLYYQQGFHLAYFNAPLFGDEIEAWIYGPVVPGVYEHFHSYESKGIEYLGDVINLAAKEESLFHEVDRTYGKYSAIGLMDMVHQEMPWKSTRREKGSIITKEKMKAFFKERLR
ncbi:hypothetical protein FACS1894181_12690 [Bacteroidia bacterium]|nr:hypothetical protein FACS189438_0960 [Bacteroidia bacterium]GHV51184.1 hypothetical protein FACS1894181_12690 [Bacteroidia bacterium]